MTPLKKPSEIERISASCRIVSRVQRLLEEALGPGATTADLDALAESTIRDCGAIPAFKGYHGFPASICASVNAQAVHGFPDATPLEEGDIVSVDVGVQLEGFFGDGAFTLGVGRIGADRERLLATTRAALQDGIDAAQPGAWLSDISHAVQRRAESGGVSVVRDFGGHGIGRALHEDPHIPNYGRPGKGPRLQPGFVFCVEPILSLGQPEVFTADDGWTVATRDGSPVAHFEHTVALTVDGPLILTQPEADLPASESAAAGRGGGGQDTGTHRQSA